MTTKAKTDCKAQGVNDAATHAVNAIMAEHPELSTTRIARMLVQKHPLVFSSEDDARRMVRYRRGATGTGDRKHRGLETPITPLAGVRESGGGDRKPSPSSPAAVDTDCRQMGGNNVLVTNAVNAIMREFPNAPSLQLARMLVARHPLLFRNTKSARKRVAYRRGAHGAKSRESRELAAPITPRIELPTSDERDFTPFIVEGCKRVLVLSDIHIPYHTASALEIAIAEGKRRNADCVLLNGDTLDFHQASDFVRDPEARDLRGERQLGIQFLSYLRQEFPDARIIFKEGNHDERLKRFILQKAPEIYDVEILGLPALLHFDRYGVEHVGDKRAVMLGGLTTLHGHELTKGFTAPAAPARTAYLKTGVSTLMSHHHTTNEYTKTILGDKIITCWTTGCLSDLHPAYNPYAGYNYGFANVDLDGQDFQVTNHRIHRGMLLN